MTMIPVPTVNAANAFPREPMLVFQSVGYGMGTWDDVRLLLQDRFAEPESLERFLRAEFNRRHAADRETSPSYEAFQQHERSETYMKVMAMVLTVYQALDEEEA